MDKRVLFFGEGDVCDEIRFGQYQPYLNRLGWEVKMTTLPNQPYQLDRYQFDGYPVAVFSRPHHHQLLLSYKEHGTKVVVDMDDDFWAIPPEHPGYRWVGRGSPDTLQQMKICLQVADLITTTTPELAERLQAHTMAPIRLIPNGWDEANPLWSRPTHPHPRPVVGWAGTITHREDFQPIVQALLHSHLQHGVDVLIGSDPEIYRMLHKIPEPHKVFVPQLPYRMYPAIFRRLDIWLVPLRDTYFNRAKSDIKLVDAGAAGKPWIASPLPFYQAWRVGGGFATSPSDWCETIGLLVESDRLRQQLAQEGRAKALTRRLSVLVQDWIRILEGL